MDLTTLVTACALAVDSKVMHALIWHQSGGEPWSFTVAGVHQPQVFRDVSDAVAERCNTSPHFNSDPIYCAIATYRGSWGRPDNAFADAVRTSVANNDAPDFEMPADTGRDAAKVRPAPRPPFHDTAKAPPVAPDDRERARLSRLFPVKSRPSERSPIDDSARDRPAVEEQKSDIQTAHPNPTQPPADGLFVPRSAQRTSP